MKPPLTMRKLLFLFCFVFGVVFSEPILAADLSQSKMTGVRFGLWSAVDAKHVEPGPGEDILTKVNAPYGEFHLSMGLQKGFAVGVSVGSCYRGETRYNDPNGYYWKKVTIYPLTCELKYYPIWRVAKSKLQPYLDGGLALVSGTENLRFGEYFGPLLYLGSYTNNYLTFGWHIGGGMDFSLSRSFVVGADFKYRGVHFGEKVGGIRDYSGPQATLGISYILKSF